MRKALSGFPHLLYHIYSLYVKYLLIIEGMRRRHRSASFVERYVFLMLADVAVCGTHDLAARRQQLFQTVSAPPHYARDGEHVSEQLAGQAEHLVAEAAVKVDVGAHALVRLAAFGKQFRAH